MDKKIQERLIHLIADQFGMWEIDIHSRIHFVDDLRADSMDLIELVMAVEEEFGITIPDEDIDRLETVHIMIEYLTYALVPEVPQLYGMNAMSRIAGFYCCA